MELIFQSRLSYIGAHDRNRTGDLILTKDALYHLSYVGTSLLKKKWSGKRGSNSRPSAWKADALPIELFPLTNYKTKIKSNGGGGRIRTSEGAADRFTVCSL